MTPGRRNPARSGLAGPNNAAPRPKAGEAAAYTIGLRSKGRSGRLRAAYELPGHQSLSGDRFDQRSQGSLAVDLLVIILILGALALFVAGVLKLFRRGKRRKGLVYVLGSLGIVALAGIIVGPQPEQDRPVASATAQPVAAEENPVNAGPESAETEAPQDAAPQPVQPDLKGFPDLPTKQRAAALGITRYAAYQRLRDLDTIRAHCTLRAEGVRIEEQKWAAIDAGGNATAITEETEAAHAEMRAAFNARFGLEGFEADTLSIAGYWPTYCDAFDKGWAVFGPVAAARTDRADAREAQGLIERMFQAELARVSQHDFFNPNVPTYARCTRERIDAKWYAGCRLINASAQSKWRIAMIGKAADGDLLLTPLNGPSITTFRAIWPDVSAQTKRQITVANFAGPQLPISDILAAFD